jgi:hypothetical protein
MWRDRSWIEFRHKAFVIPRAQPCTCRIALTPQVQQGRWAMPERPEIIDRLSTLGFERGLRRIRRFFRPTFAFDQREEAVRSEFLATVLRIWIITIFIVTLPMLIITVSETIEATFFPESRYMQARSWARKPAVPGLSRSLVRPALRAE